MNTIKMNQLRYTLGIIELLPVKGIYLYGGNQII